MSQRNKSFYLRAGLFAGALALAAGISVTPAHASDPLPGDAIAPPVNINIALYYNIFTSAGALGAVHGSTYSKDTDIRSDINVLRYIRTFNTPGIETGAQIYVPYVSFLGSQKLGVKNIPGPDVPALGGPLPSYGAGSAALSHSSGFAEPNIGVFAFPINNPATGTYLVVAPWIQVPIGNDSNSSVLNAASNVWTYELEIGFRTELFGNPATQNLAIELWGEGYEFGANKSSAYASPAVSANSIPAIYNTFHVLSAGLIPNSNPLQAASSTPATFHEQSSEEFRVYLPYEFNPATDAYIVPGIYQSFGGKQTYTLRNGVKVDSGNRTDETQFRLIASTFISPTTQVMAVGLYDLANHGGPVNRGVEIRIAKFF
jgi:hypothetical protein